MVIVSYHASGSGEPFYDASVIGPRTSIYTSTTYYLPSVIVDGGGTGNTQTLWIIGANSPDTAYTSYRTKIDSEKATTTYLQITPQGDLTPSSADVTATVYASDPVTGTNLYVSIVVIEDTQYAMGSNGNPFHRAVARAYYETPLTIGVGETVIVSHSFNLGSWDKNRLGFVVFVQSHTKSAGWVYSGYTFYNAPVIQAAKGHFTTPNTMYVRDTGTTADYTEYMERSLAQANRAFETYNSLAMGDSGATDNMADPTTMEMEEFGAVMWNTGDATLNTLTAANKASLTAYLDSSNVGGSLFVTGRAIAAELGGADPFIASYLHTVYSGGTSVGTSISGVAGDPISGSYSAVNLPITGTPSDVIDPGAGASTTFVYPGMLNAAVRADHDANSRVVYLGANYFAGTDTQTRKTDVIGKILDWLDGVAGPRVSMVTPNGGEEYSPGDMVRVQWKAIDVEVPIDGIDIFFTTSLQTPSWTPVATGEPNDGVYTWTVPSVQTTDCGFKVVARDGDLGTPDGVGISAGPCTIGFPNISMTKDVSNPTPQAGEVVTYTITLTNSGSLSGYATVLDTLPSGVTYLSDDGGSTGVSGYSGGNTTAYWTVVVPPSSNVVWNIQATVLAGPPGTVVTNWASFNSTNARGGSAQSGSDSAAFQIPALQNWQITLDAGRRLVSIPILLADYRVEVVLASIAGRYSYVRQFQAADPVSPWKSYDPLRAYNTLTHLRPETGFWIDVTSTTTLILVGARAGTTDIVLLSGWNMVGYPSLAGGFTVGQMKASIGLPNIVVEGYDATSAPYNLQVLPDSYVMKQGEGYWVRVPAIGMWHVSG